MGDPCSGRGAACPAPPCMCERKGVGKRVSAGRKSIECKLRHVRRTSEGTRAWAGRMYRHTRAKIQLQNMVMSKSCQAKHCTACSLGFEGGRTGTKQPE
eukprot:1159578-Pelagomonas_calceolata.AAC.4